MRRRVINLFVGAAALAATALLQIVVRPAGAHADPPPVGPQPVRAVILVDESKSLNASDVDRERDAAAQIAQSELSTQSQIAIVGFGSSNGPGQSAVNV